MICLILLLCAAQVERDEIYIGLNSSFNSELLKDELTRDWTQYNPEANLTISQIEEVKKQGEYYNKIRDELCSDFHFVDYLKTPNEIRKYPCIKVGKYGVWKEIDERAFLTSTFPLLTVIALADDSPKGLARQLRRYEKLVENNKAECELVRKHNSSIMKQFYPLHENFIFHRRKGEIVTVQGFITKQGQFGLIYTTEDLEMPKGLLQYPEDIPPFVYMNSRFPWECKARE